MPIIDPKNKISVKVDPEVSESHSNTMKLAEHFRNELAKQRHDKGAIKK